MPITIDLDGPDGNAFVLLGKAKRIARQLGWESGRIDLLLHEMRNSDYDNLLDVFKREFGDLVEFVGRDDNDEDDDNEDV